MRLRHELLLDQARVVGIGIEPKKDDPKITLAIRASLTTEVAEAFGCRELIYAGTVPRSGFGTSVPLDGDELDCGIHFKHDSMAFDVVANTIGHYVAKFTGTGPHLLFRITLTGFATTIAEMAEKVKIDPLEIILNPSQMHLSLTQPPSTEAPEAEDEDYLLGFEPPVEEKTA